MELDNKGLGRLRHVANARDVWTSEAGDFTPWLAENLDVLADELGLSLTLVQTEVPVGDFRLDIQAETHDGRLVIVENQLERTDHSHLGQLLVYASGLEAASVIWIAPRFREDHRRTLDWLNERTDSGVDFFGVEIGVVQIGDGPRAPVFEVVARPNNWQKGVKEGGGTPTPGPTVSPLNATRQELFAQILNDVVAQRPSIRMPALSKGHWMSFASGPWGNWDVSAASEGRFRVEAYIDSGVGTVNKQLFDELHADAAACGAKAGYPLEWERLDDKRACRIATYAEGGDLGDEQTRARLHKWAVESVLGMFDALNETLRARARELRDVAKAQAVSEPGSDSPPATGLLRDPAAVQATVVL